MKIPLPTKIMLDVSNVRDRVLVDRRADDR